MALKSPRRGVQSIRRHYSAALGSFPSRSFYVDATLGNDANSGTYPGEAWQTFGPVNGGTFLPGDWVRFKRGEMWREQLVVPSSGIAGARIFFSAYGVGARPVFNGSDIVTGWAADGGSYVATVTTEPDTVFYDGARLTENDGATNTVGANEWDWNANSLWANVGEDPDIGTLEAGQRDNCIHANDVGFVTFQNLHLTKSNEFGFNVWNAADRDGLIFQGSEVSWCRRMGVFAAGLENFIVRDVSSHDHLEEHGIYLSGETTAMNGALIERCLLYSNGAHGLQLNPNGVARITNPVIRRCHIYGNTSVEVNDQCSDGARYINNIIRDAGTATGTLLIEHRAGQTALSAINAQVYHNTLVVGAGARGLDIGSSSIGIVAKNNITHCATGASLVVGVAAGGDLTADNNQYELDAADWIYNWKGSWRNAIADWRTDSGQDASAQEGDPLFVNLANNWHLQVGSPCRGAGAIDTGVTDDYDGVARPDPPTQPDIGAYRFVP